MNSCIEYRSLFTDYKLIEESFRLKDGFKMSKFSNKIILKKIYKSFIKNKIIKKKNLKIYILSTNSRMV